MDRITRRTVQAELAAKEQRFHTKIDELKRNTQHLAIPTPRKTRKFSTWNPPSHEEGAYPQNCMVQQPRNQVSDMHFDKFPNPATFRCWKTNFKTKVCFCSGFPRKQCIGSKKWRWSIRWTILRRRSQLEGVDSRILRCLMQRLLPS